MYDAYKQLQTEGDFVLVKSICEKCCTVKKSSIVGYCHCHVHRGYLTKQNANTHDCFKKQCRHLEKFDDAPYWENAENSARKKSENRKQKKITFAEKQQKLKRMERAARDWVELLNYPITIASVTERLDKTYAVNFVSETDRNDAFLYSDICSKLKYEFEDKFQLIRIRKSDGSFAKISDLKSGN